MSNSDPREILRINTVERDGKIYVNGVELKRMYSEEYGIFIDVHGQYRNCKGEEIYNINAYLYKCRGY